MPSLVYFGTPEPSKAVLAALFYTGSYDIKGVVTQPDRPVGRKHLIQKSAVKIFAETHQIPVFQPESFKNFQFPFAHFDIAVVYQYGLIIPSAILNLPRFGALNIHPSLLPRYRGASPMQNALLNGDSTTAISIIRMDEKMDHGPIIVQKILTIDPKDTYLTLSEKVTAEAIPLLLNTIPAWLAGSISAREQDHASATFCSLFTRDDGKLDFSRSATELYNRFRGLTPWPGVWCLWKGQRLKLLKLALSTLSLAAGKIEYHDNKLYIGCAEGSLQIEELQLEGKKAFLSDIFLQGHTDFIGSQAV